ncbi:hypothetical protein VYU27_002721 [Nannochloropsis oceanica]
MASSSGGGSGGGSVMMEKFEPELDFLLGSPGFWAKLGHHPYWPARAASKEEQRRYASYQRKATQVCVKFFGSNDIGWIHPASLVAFEEGMRKSFNTNAKVTKNAKFVAGVEEALRNWDACQRGGGGGSLHDHYRHGDVFPSAWHQHLSLSSTDGVVSPMHTHASADVTAATAGAPAGGGVPQNGHIAFQSSLGGGPWEGQPLETCLLQEQYHSDFAPGLGILGGGAAAGGGGGEEGVEGARRGRGRPPRVSENAAAELEAKRRRASLTAASAAAIAAATAAAAAEKRATWGGWGMGGGSTGEADWEGRGGGGGGGRGSDDSEFECFICMEPGMLMQCDAPNCRKVYHKPCLGMLAGGDQFFCPRHRCAICRVSEAELAAKSGKSKGAISGSKGRGVEVSGGDGGEKNDRGGASDVDDDASTTAAGAAATAAVTDGKPNSSSKKTSTSNSSKRKLANGSGSEAMHPVLWKCGSCPVAYCPSHLPPGLAPTGRQKYVAGDDSNQCSHCEHPAPRIQLAVLLERSWARLATNYLSLPFMRPFLNGAKRPSQKEGGREAAGWERPLDIVEIGSKIRAGHYGTADEYLEDLFTLREQTVAFLQAAKPAEKAEKAEQLQQQQRKTGGLVEGTYAPVLEALDTLRGNAKRYLESNRKEIVKAEALVEEEEEGSTPGAGAVAAATAAVATGPGIGGGVAWRGELESLTKCGEVGEYSPARTLEEWVEYVRKAPMIHVASQKPFPVLSEEAEREDMEKGEIARVISQMRFEDTWPHRSTLLQRDHLQAALEEQAGLLRRCMEGHALLRKSIAEEKSVVMEFSVKKRRRREGGRDCGREEEEEEGLEEDDHFVTMGDMHIVKELQISNGNLRARLESKHGLLQQREGQLWAARRAFEDVQEQNVRLREELAEARARVGGLEEKIKKRKESEVPMEWVMGRSVEGTAEGNQREVGKERERDSVSAKLQNLLQPQHQQQQQQQQQKQQQQPQLHQKEGEDYDDDDDDEEEEEQQQQQQTVATSPSTTPTTLSTLPEEQQLHKDVNKDGDEEEVEMLGSASPPATVSAATTTINSSSSGGSGGVEMEGEDANNSF